MTCGVDDHVAARELLVACVALVHARRLGIKAHGVQQVVDLGAAEDLVLVAQVELRDEPLREQRVCHMRAHVAVADDSYACHTIISRKETLLNLLYQLRCSELASHLTLRLFASSFVHTSLIRV